MYLTTSEKRESVMSTFPSKEITPPYSVPCTQDAATSAGCERCECEGEWERVRVRCVVCVRAVCCSLYSLCRCISESAVSVGARQYSTTTSLLSTVNYIKKSKL